jgi:hypothetical protein
VTTARDRSQHAGMPSASPVTPTRPLRKRSRPRTGSGRWAANRRPGARLAGPSRALQGPSEAVLGSRPTLVRAGRPVLGWSAGLGPAWALRLGAMRPSGAGALPTGGRRGEAGAGPRPTGLPVRLGAGPGSRAGPAGWRSRDRSVGLAISRWRRRPRLDGAVRAPVRWARCQPVRRVSDRRGRGESAPRLPAPCSRRRCDSPPGRRDLDPPHSVALPPTPRPAPLQSGWGRQDRW